MVWPVITAMENLGKKFTFCDFRSCYKTYRQIDRQLEARYGACPKICCYALSPTCFITDLCWPVRITFHLCPDQLVRNKLTQSPANKYFNKLKKKLNV